GGPNQDVICIAPFVSAIRQFNPSGLKPRFAPSQHGRILLWYGPAISAIPRLLSHAGRAIFWVAFNPYSFGCASISEPGYDCLSRVANLPSSSRSSFLHGRPRSSPRTILLDIQQLANFPPVSRLNLTAASRHHMTPPILQVPVQPPESSNPAPPCKAITSNGANSPSVAHHPVTLEYLVYSKTTAFQMAENRTAASVTTPKDWDKMEHDQEIIWEPVLGNLSWADVQKEVIKILDGTRPLLGKHLDALSSSNLISWQFTLVHDTVYGVAKKVILSSDEDFADFVAAVHLHPKWPIKIKIVMPHPATRSKQVQVVQKGNDNLTMSYGNDKDRLKLEHLQARQTANPKADITASSVTPFIERITRHIMEKYSCTTESMRIKDPQDPLASIRIHGPNLWIWGRALYHNAPGVDEDHPPRDKTHFASEPKRVYTRVEDAVRNKTGKGSSKGNNRPVRPLPISGSDSDASPRPKFTPSRVSTSGRIMAPRLAPPGEQTITLDSHQGPNGSGNEEDELESITSDLPDVELYRRAPPASRALSTTSTDIEIMRAPADMQGPERSPARKIARSPVNGLDRSISRLNFNQRRRPAASVSPQRKRGGSQASTVDHSHGPAGSAASDVPEGAEEIEEEPPFRGSARNLPNLNAAGLALTMDEFLDHCNFSRDNHTPRVLIGLSQVHHWDFFYREASVSDLLRLGYPFAIATQLLRGAHLLEATHVERSSHDNSTEDK
ncbi:hypothetical protein PSTT_07486, partial [Puccinia striiformis]